MPKLHSWQNPPLSAWKISAEPYRTRWSPRTPYAFSCLPSLTWAYVGVRSEENRATKRTPDPTITSLVHILIDALMLTTVPVKLCELLFALGFLSRWHAAWEGKDIPAFVKLVENVTCFTKTCHYSLIAPKPFLERWTNQRIPQMLPSSCYVM